jgi:hypothetical protein
MVLGAPPRRAFRASPSPARIVRLTASLNGMPCSRALLQKPGKVIVDGERGPHSRIVDAM